MSAEFFLDTNVIVYAFDDGAPEKRAIALELIRQALQTGQGAISTKAVQEFLNVATRKFSVPMKISDAGEFLIKVLNPLCKVYPDLAYFQDGLDIQEETGLSFYDSLIIAGAIQAGCSTLYSEDLQDGRTIRGVRVVNPFPSEARKRLKTGVK